MATFGLGNFAQQQLEETIDSSTPWIAASEGNLPVLESSLKSLNLPVTASDENGYTLLHAAASYNQTAIMHFLFGSQVSVHACDNDGDTSLHYAGNAQSAKLLIDVAKVNPSVTNKQGKTALQSKQEDLDEMMRDEDEDEEDVETLKLLVEYLSSLKV